MKQCVLIIVLLFITVIIIPLVIINKGEDEAVNVSNANITVSSEKPESSNNSSNSLSDEDDIFKIKDNESGEIISISGREFTYGVVAAEMPISYEDEALKAQAVAAYTYYSKKRSEASLNSDENLSGADFYNNVNGTQIYLTEEQIKEKYSSNFEAYWSKLKGCVDSVYGETLCEDNELITSTFYAISSGKTESSEDIFGGRRDYLVAVPSNWDMYAPGYCTNLTLSPEEFKRMAGEYWKDLNFSGDCSSWIGKSEKTNSGTVKSINICSKEVLGSEVRAAFSLRSANFDILYDGNNFNFTVRGYGHGVGMSQYGAQFMAKQGSTYRQILNWYYPNTIITKNNPK